MTDRVDDAVEQSSDLVDRERNQQCMPTLGWWVRCGGVRFGTGYAAPFSASRRRIVRKAAAAIDKVMWRYQAV